MNRELKFRAWTRTGEWDEDGENRQFKMIDGDSLYPMEFEPFKDLLKDIDDEYYVMQFTGLKDKNGNEIYEGDIIKWPIGYNDFSTLIMYVGYNELGMRLYKRLPCECCGGHKCGSIPSFGIFKKCEVIGNIYEHSHLLK